MNYYNEIKNELVNNEINRRLKNYSIFFYLIEKGALMGHQLSWSHYRELIVLSNKDEIEYYIVNDGNISREYKVV